jgi:hypothetical protein
VKPTLVPEADRQTAWPALAASSRADSGAGTAGPSLTLRCLLTPLRALDNQAPRRYNTVTFFRARLVSVLGRVRAASVADILLQQSRRRNETIAPCFRLQPFGVAAGCRTTAGRRMLYPLATHFVPVRSPGCPHHVPGAVPGPDRRTTRPGAPRLNQPRLGKGGIRDRNLGGGWPRRPRGWI